MAAASRKRINISLLIPFLVIALLFGVTLWKKYRSSRELPSVPQLQQPAGKRTVVLFFVEDGTRLAREARELDSCNAVEACLKDVLEELVNGPVGEFDESLPDGTVMNSVQINNDLASIDLNKTFAETLPSGSSSEILAVYSIVDTVAANFPQITKVKLTIEGDAKSQLHHLDLSEPLEPDYSLELPSVVPADKTAVPRTSIKKKGQP